MLGPVVVNGTLSLQINTTKAAVSLLDGTELPAGPYIQLAGTNLSIDLGSGGAGVSGSFTIQQSTDSRGNTLLLLGASWR